MNVRTPEISPSSFLSFSNTAMGTVCAESFLVTPHKKTKRERGADVPFCAGYWALWACFPSISRVRSCVPKKAKSTACSDTLSPPACSGWNQDGIRMELKGDPSSSFSLTFIKSQQKDEDFLKNELEKSPSMFQKRKHFTIEVEVEKLNPWIGRCDKLLWKKLNLDSLLQWKKAGRNHSSEYLFSIWTPQISKRFILCRSNRKKITEKMRKNWTLNEMMKKLMGHWSIYFIT